MPLSRFAPALVLLALLTAGCAAPEARPLDKTGTVYRNELSFVGAGRNTNDTFPVPHGPSMVHVLVEGRNEGTRGANIHVRLFDPEGNARGECLCGARNATASFGSGESDPDASGRWTLAFEPTGAGKIRVTVTTT